MFRLLLAVAICGALAFWLLHPRDGRNITADKVQPMLHTLSENGCPQPAGSVGLGADATEKQSLQALQQTIEACEQRAARRDAGGN